MKNLTKRIAGFSLKKRDRVSSHSFDKEEEIAQPQEDHQKRVTSSSPLSVAQLADIITQLKAQNTTLHTPALHMLSREAYHMPVSSLPPTGEYWFSESVRRRIIP